MISTDVVIVGAGPCGLFQVFELGLLGIKAHVVESLDKLGGQCAELYPDKPIYDIPALPVCGALELVQRLEKQIEPFNPTFHLSSEVNSLESVGERFHLHTSSGESFDAGAVVVAAGAGSFQPVLLKVDGADDVVDKQLFYQVRDAKKHYGKRVLVLGGGDSALDWALNLQPHAEAMTLIHRSDRFRAQTASIEKMQELCERGAMQQFIGSIVGIENLADGLHVEISGSDKKDTLVVDHILCFYGLTPKLGPIANWGLELNKQHIVVDTEKFETSRPGIFAIGDVNHYPGKKKLILSGFHEAALAAFAIKKHLTPEEKVHLQYTTTSPLMKKRLGV